jgi:murein L,D-transpeptidase YafK
MPRFLCLCLLLFALIASPGLAQAEATTDGPVSPPATETAPATLEAELAQAGFKLGTPAFVRIFKEDSRLEIWLWRNGRFDLYRGYNICKWSGVLGPKLYEGDRQSPEGVYYITGGDLIVNARWHRAMNVGYPNARDQALGLTGGGILIHGRCSSIGCFAMTDDEVEEIYGIVEAALEDGQPRVPVHVFPFPLTQQKLAEHEASEWSDFWRELKPGYDLFLRDGLPPRTFVCNGQYAFQSRRAPVVSLASNPVCTPVTKPARPVLASRSWRVVGARPFGSTAPQTASLRLPATCGPRDRRCQLFKTAMKSPVPCPRKYGRCRNPQVAAVKSIDCPLKFPRCRVRAGGAKPALATLKSKISRR